MIQDSQKFFDNYPYLGFITGFISYCVAGINFLMSDSTLKVVGAAGVYAGTILAFLNLGFRAHSRWLRWRNRHKN
jgi:hypothetical protein